MSAVRGSTILAGFFTLTVPLMPVQAVLVRTSPRAARRFPHWYHRQVCRLMGIRLEIEGAVAEDRPVLLVCNHTSWLDIPVLSALAPVSFVAKREVGSWPFVSSLARLQRTVFIDRTRRQATGDAANEMSRRLASGDTLVLFPEGTSSDGNRVLPFKSSLFGAVEMGQGGGEKAPVVQTAAVVYTHLRGVPMSRADRPRVGWYGDMEMRGHAWELLKSGPIVATIKGSPPVPLDDYAGRKDLAMRSERDIRRAVHTILRGHSDGAVIEPVEPPRERRRGLQAGPAVVTQKWT
jgi:lyso-ornithine lipid O-acyltransferase